MGTDLAPGAVRPGAQSFIWPVDGRVVLPYGSQEDGITIKGIVVETRQDDRVLAAADGQVVFVDEKLKGYGKTLILEHSQEFFTVYARNSEILAKPGQRVAQGQPVARVSRQSPKDAPKLYFEIRKKNQAKDPLLYLPYKRF